MEIANIVSDYQSRWEKGATVRSRPQRKLHASETSGYFYPLSRQPICLHPKVAALGEEARQYILVQSLYKYANDIAVTETEIINEGALMISANKLGFVFPDEYRLNALTVIVDEAYHAYVAMDCMKQIFEYTQLEPLTLPEEIELSKALRLAKADLPQEYHNWFHLIAVSLAENTLTKEIVGMQDQEETNVFFQNILKDHLLDESRHSGFFFYVLKEIWAQLPDAGKSAVAAVLPRFLQEYLDLSVQKAFDRQTLMYLSFTQEQADEIIAQTYDGFALTPTHPMVQNITKLFTRAGLLDHQPTSQALCEAGLIDLG